MKIRILDLGAGERPYKVSKSDEVIILDKLKLSSIDVVHNLEEKYLPFHDNSFDIVHAKYILEHIHNLINLMEEIHRILKPGGRLIAYVPFFAARSAHTDITHCHWFTINSFDNFLEGTTINWYTKCRFKLIKRKLTFPTLKFLGPIINLWQELYEKYFSYIIPAYAIYFELEAVK